MNVSITNISYAKVQSIPHTAPLISITDQYRPSVQVPNAQKRPHLILAFSAGDYIPEPREGAITPEQVREAAAFIEANREHGLVYIHCTEGRIRSYSLCDALTYCLDNVTHDHSRACIKQGIIDDYTNIVVMRALLGRRS